MKMANSLLRRAAGLCLAALLVVPALAAEPLSAKQRQEDLDFLYEKVLAGFHPDAFANTPESEFLALKAEIEGRLETVSGTHSISVRLLLSKRKENLNASFPIIFRSNSIAPSIVSLAAFFKLTAITGNFPMYSSQSS